MTWDEWTGVVLWLNASYPGQRLEPQTARSWFEDLELQDVATVAVALRRCRRTSGYLPQLATILEVCREVRTEHTVATYDPKAATRRCGTCARSPVAGWVPTVEDAVEVWYPCPVCRPAQHNTWKART